ncbi:MAG: CerR family C-terminal domain-containing protein [Planctomycetaceae bacterium]|nr:CerR family C-terminal domain-containing protein [Planctomycetaceae bacterium]
MVDDTKQRLIQAAGEVFASKGFEAASVREISTLAGANIAAINYHFGDKQKLYLACLEQTVCSQQEDLACAPWTSPGLPPHARLRAFIEGMLRSRLDPARPRWHMEIMLREMAHPSPTCAEMVERFIRPMAESLWSILGEFIPNAPQDRHGWVVGFSIVGQVLFYYVHQPIVRTLMGDDEFNRLTVTELAEHITRFCLAALGQGPAIQATVSQLAAVTHNLSGNPTPQGASS